MKPRIITLLLAIVTLLMVGCNGKDNGTQSMSEKGMDCEMMKNDPETSRKMMACMMQMTERDTAMCSMMYDMMMDNDSIMKMMNKRA
ncbi:MAG: hypothetical protein ACOYXT_26370 [Bacteroidota bacterium]